VKERGLFGFGSTSKVTADSEIVVLLQVLKL